MTTSHVPMRPASKKEWDAVVTLDFRLPPGDDVHVRDVGLTLTQGTVEVDRFSRRLQMRSSSDAAYGSRLVTLVGGGAMDLAPFDADADAILMGWLGGQAFGLDGQRACHRLSGPELGDVF